MRQPTRHFIFDFDSTLIQSESLPELARISLRHHPERTERLREIERITELTATGQMSMAEGLTQRIELAAAHRKHLESLIRVLRRAVSPSIKRHREFFRKYRQSVYVISNGFHEIVEPVVERLGIRPSNVFANRFVLDSRGYLVGFDANNPLAHQDGKTRVLRGLQLEGEVLVIGDGYSDSQVRQAGVATRFYAFTENVRRQEVVDAADHVLPSFDEFLYLHELPLAHSYPRTRMRVLLVEGIHPAAAEYFEKEGYVVRSLPGSPNEDELRSELAGATLLGIRSATRISRRVLEAASDLQGIGAYCIGTNQIDLEACAEHGVVVFNAPYANTRSVVELAIGEIVMLARRVFEKATLMRSGIWEKSAAGAFEIRGKTLGIVGYGNIGSQLSVLAEALGMNVLYYDIVEKLPLGNATKCGSLKELLKRADIVSVHVDGNPLNHHLFGEQEFRAMREGALFLNLSRGFVVDVDALERALRTGRLGGAAIDVFPVEPAGQRARISSPLAGLPNVILTPHIGGSTREAQRAIADFVSSTLVTFVNTGNSFGSVNFPGVQLPDLRRAHRFIHIHANEPGVLAAINRVMASHGINILGQYLKTNERTGYVITDVSKKYQPNVIEELRRVPHTIKFRVLY